MYVFGGWDGQQRYDDLYKLSIGSWQWELLEPTAAAAAANGGVCEGVHRIAAPAAAAASSLKPCPRADHAMVGVCEIRRMRCVITTEAF
jgi:hypothetical protein